MTRAAKAEKATKSRSEVSVDDRLAEVERKVLHLLAMQKAMDASIEKLERMVERLARMR
jgi:type I site-specific restriction endonuclease